MFRRQDRERENLFHCLTHGMHWMDKREMEHMTEAVTGM